MSVDYLLSRDTNKTLIMATHNPDIARLANRVLRMYDGRLQQETIAILT